MADKAFNPQSGDQWVGKTYTIKGNWSVEAQGGGFYFHFKDDFSTSSGPDLKLYLTELKMSDIGDRDSVDKGGVFVAELDSHKGAQSYRLPEGIDLSAFNSFVIHCKAYSVVWGGIELENSK